jgi:hypothetical protein
MKILKGIVFLYLMASSMLSIAAPFTNEWFWWVFAGVHALFVVTYGPKVMHWVITGFEEPEHLTVTVRSTMASKSTPVIDATQTTADLTAELKAKQYYHDSAIRYILTIYIQRYPPTLGSTLEKPLAEILEIVNTPVEGIGKWDIQYDNGKPSPIFIIETYGTNLRGPGSARAAGHG